MIARSFFVALVLLAVYSLVIRWLPAKVDTSQTIWGANLIHTQSYLYGDVGPDDVVLLGSSLTENLDLDSLAGRRLHNLGLGGQGVFDGLNIVAASDQRPGVALIEMNIIMKAANEQFAAVSFNPAANIARRHVPALRQKHQPVGVLMGLARWRSETAKSPTQELHDQPINGLSLGLKQKAYAVAVDESELEETMDLLKLEVGQLQAKGTNVVFFEAPVHPSLCEAPRARSIRAAFLRHFPKNRFAYLPQPPCADYETTDGHHLGKLSLARYAEWMRSAVQELDL